MTPEEKVYEVTKARQIIDALRDPYKDTTENYEIDRALLALQRLSIYLSLESK